MPQLEPGEGKDRGDVQQWGQEQQEYRVGFQFDVRQPRYEFEPAQDHKYRVRTYPSRPPSARRPAAARTIRSLVVLLVCVVLFILITVVSLVVDTIT